MHQLNRGSMKPNTKISRCYVITRRIDVTQQTKCRNMNSVLESNHSAASPAFAMLVRVDICISHNDSRRKKKKAVR